MGYTDFITDNPVYQSGKAFMDGVGVLDSLEVISNTKNVKDALPGAGLLDRFPAINSGMDTIGAVTSVIDLLKAQQNATRFEEGGDPVAALDAFHDVVSGTAGLIGLDKGPMGAVAKAAGAGFALGDMIAPTVFGSEKEDNEASGYQDATEEFKPTTGNRFYDFMVDLYGIGT